MGKNKGFIGIGFILAIVLGIVVIGGGAYYLGKNNSSREIKTDENVLLNIENQKLSEINNNTSSTSTTSPLITSISPSSGIIGTTIELKGTNLAGFEGDLDVIIENDKGESAFLKGIGLVPRDDKTIRVMIEDKVCKQNNSYSGEPCNSWLNLIPGTYKIYTMPWGNKSNEMIFTINSGTSTTNLKTYSNSEYGFSFDYPNNWNLSEDKSKKEVTINTNDLVSVADGGHAGYPSWSINFKTTDKTFFIQQHISTKWGEITYNEKESAVFADDRCIKVEKFLSDLGGNNTSLIQVVRYGGSLMSDPAYSNSAILTSNGEIIIVDSQQGTEITPEINNQLSIIANSFKLLNGNNVFVPACAK